MINMMYTQLFFMITFSFYIRRKDRKKYEIIKNSAQESARNLGGVMGVNPERQSIGLTITNY